MIMSYKLFGYNVLEIERLCSVTGSIVVGGFSKLLKYLENTIDFKSIKYWVDLRYGAGDFLLKHDFVISHETLGWKWTDFQNTYNRRLCKANMDDRELSEKEYAQEMGLLKIYDAGQRLYVRHRV